MIHMALQSCCSGDVVLHAAVNDLSTELPVRKDHFLCKSCSVDSNPFFRLQMDGKQGKSRQRIYRREVGSGRGVPSLDWSWSGCGWCGTPPPRGPTPIQCLQRLLLLDVINARETPVRINVIILYGRDAAFYGWE